MESVVVMSLILVSLTAQSVRLSSLYASNVEVFYVKPTSPASAECPSGENVPCHTLQYYADHSNFTSNSEFRFLEGEHLLESVVSVANITNLSLIGAGPGVKILCQSVPSGFNVINFSTIKFENLSVSDCRGSSANVTFLLEGGSEASISHVNISSSRGGGVRYVDAMGSFCKESYSFLFDHNFLITQGHGVYLKIYCTNVKVKMENSTFNTKGSLHHGLELLGQSLTNNSISVRSTIFVGSGVRVLIDLPYKHNLLNCSNHFISFTGVTITRTNATLLLLYYSGHASTNCSVLIKDSSFSDSEFSNRKSSAIWLNYNSDVPGIIILQNVTVMNLNNTARQIVVFLWNVHATIINCTFENNRGAALLADFKSVIIFKGTKNFFKNNTSARGAGIHLVNEAYIHLHDNSTVYFENNQADAVGGAINVAYKIKKFWDFCHTDSHLTGGAKLIFINNTAGQAGSSVFGGNHVCCYNGGTVCSKKYFDDIFNISNTEEDPSALTSNPYRVCSCEHNRRQPNCSHVPDVINTVPGGVFTLRLAVVDQFYGGTVPGDIHAYFDISSNATVGRMQSTQACSSYCNDFKYSVFFSTNKYEKLKLTVIDYYDADPILIATVKIHDCPLGFALSHDIGKCVCAPVIDRDNVKCFTEDRKILRQGNTWIGFVNTSSNDTDILFSDDCPSGYCLAHPVNVTVTSGDDQCESHRTGILCGQCKEGYSLTLSTQECRKCSNTYLLLIIPLAFLGILLVVLLFILNLTVSEGTINGLVFYANVIEMNYILHLPKQQNYLYIFLAWLNLDLGIDTCLFDGMDAYTETWLQFVFPFYLWMIILLIIVFYNKFPTVAARLGGGNAVNVLATLLLLSYTKLQQTVVTILSFTSLKYPSSGTVHYVWLYDANVEYFKGKHLYLGITAIAVLVFLIIPYTLCLAFFQHLQAHSQHRIFHWVNKLKPVFDAYAGPYKNRFRFWTGMLLIIRTLLIIIFTINISGSIDLNLLVILVVSLTLLLASSNGIYQKWIYNYLESFFYLQLGVFAGGVAYSRLGHSSKIAVIDASAGMSLIVTIAVVVYQLVEHSRVGIKKYVYLLQGYANLVEEDSVHDFSGRQTS